MFTHLSSASGSPSRRWMLHLLAAAVGSTAGWCETESGSSLEIDRSWPGSVLPGESAVELRYRVNATIVLLSLPVFWRSGVGAARMAVRQLPGEAGRRLAIEFAAESDPSRAHGLDRRGWIRESVLERAGEPVSSAMLGLMTDSPEQSVEQARRAFRENNPAPRLVAIDSSASSGITRSRVVRFQAPPAYAPIESLDYVRQRFETGGAAWKQTAWEFAAGRAPNTFLYALLRALERPGQVTQSLYVFNEVQYRLHTESSLDREQGKQFADARLIGSPDRVFRVHVRIENLTAPAHPIHLQLWTDASRPLPCPLRIEFAPRPFLRLTLERLPPAPNNSPKEQI